MDKIELIYDSSCPNIEKARERIREVLSELHTPHDWAEWDRANPDAPEYVKDYGSPTILVNEKDVARITDGTAGESCRLYRDERGGVEGVPSIEMIRKAITLKNEQPGSKNWLTSLAAIPAVAMSSLPLLSCPLCWPLYTSILGSLGLSFFNYTPYLFPLTSLFLLIALASIWYQTNRAHSSYLPLFLAVAFSVAILIGKFWNSSFWIVAPGVLGLIASVLWNLVLISRERKIEEGGKTCFCTPIQNGVQNKKEV